jgi:4-hydroxy-tetrahydrodipicolinate reductase
MTVRLAVAGATGRMGREVLAAADDREGVEAVLAVNRDPNGESVAGRRIRPAADLPRLLDDREPNVLVEFTGPGSAVEYARHCGAAGVAFVSGTTGLSDAQREDLRAVAGSVPVLHAANFSRGIGLVERLVELAARELPDYDVEVVESHHAGKRDAPSGTAGDLLAAVDAGRECDHDRVYGREGESLRSGGEVGVHSLRAGDVTGEHSVVLAGDGERVRIEHRAGDRRAFAAGAVEAAAALAGRDPGYYDLPEVRR